MKGIHHKRQSRHLNDLDTAIDRLMAVYFSTTRLISRSPDWTTAEFLDDLSIEVNNVRNVAHLAPEKLATSTEELIGMLMIKTTHCILEGLRNILTMVNVDEVSGTTQFTCWTDRSKVMEHQDKAYFLMTLRNSSLLTAYNIRLTIMDGAAKVLAA